MLPAATIRTAIEERLFGADRAELPIRWTPASSGLSDASVWRVARGNFAFAVRRWWEGVDPRFVAWVARTLNEPSVSGLRFIATPIEQGGVWPFTDASSGVWEAAQWKAGIPLDEASEKATAVAASIEGLVAFHQCVDGRRGFPNEPVSTFAKRIAHLRAIQAKPLSYSSSLSKAYPELPSIARRIPALVPQAIRMLTPWGGVQHPMQTIHGDARPEHFLLEGGKLAGLIDFGAMRVDTPLADLARLAGELAAGDAARRDALSEAYGKAAGIEIDPHAIAALDLSAAVLSGANWLRWLGQPSEPERDPRHVRRRLRSIVSRLKCT